MIYLVVNLTTNHYYVDLLMEVFMGDVLTPVVSAALSSGATTVTENLGTTAVHIGSDKTVYTYTATGTVGQTATVLGSNDGTNWVTIGTLTVATDAESSQDIDAFSAIHAFKFIKKSGDAVVAVSRG